MNVSIVEYNFSLPGNTLLNISLTESSKIVNYILKILQSSIVSRYLGTVYQQKLIILMNITSSYIVDFIEISHFLITPMLPIITF